MNILVTGFEPFGGEPINPSQQAVARLASRRDSPAAATRTLPVSFDRALPALQTAVLETAPAIVLCVGAAGGRAELSLERVAVNLTDAPLPDNDGRQPIDCPVAEDGPAAYFASLPVRQAAAALRETGLPAGLSLSAGTFICNHVFYGLLHFAATRRLPLLGGFLHTPFLPEQAARHPGMPSMAAEEIARGIAVVLRATAAALA